MNGLFMGDVSSLEDVYARCGGQAKFERIIRSLSKKTLTVEAVWAGNGSNTDSMVIILFAPTTKEYYLLQGYRKKTDPYDFSQRAGRLITIGGLTAFKRQMANIIWGNSFGDASEFFAILARSPLEDLAASLASTEDKT